MQYDDERLPSDDQIGLMQRQYADELGGDEAIGVCIRECSRVVGVINFCRGYCSNETERNALDQAAWALLSIDGVVESESVEDWSKSPREQVLIEARRLAQIAARAADFLPFERGVKIAIKAMSAAFALRSAIN